MAVALETSLFARFDVGNGRSPLLLGIGVVASVVRSRLGIKVIELWFWFVFKTILWGKLIN